MKRSQAGRLLTHEFVEVIPDRIEDGKLYVSMIYATAVHRCCCGCGNEVVTPFSPQDWKLTFNGESVSLSPSIGNWGFTCQSHYWIRENEVVWARQASPECIETELLENCTRCEYEGEEQDESIVAPVMPNVGETRLSIWQKVKAWWFMWTRRN